MHTKIKNSCLDINKRKNKLKKYFLYFNINSCKNTYKI